MMTPTLRFDIGDIGEIARRYQYPLSETELLALKPRINDRGYMTKEELAEVAYWKAPRSARHVKRNAEEYVVEVTRFAFGTAGERAKIQSLTMLDGVLWPTASVILHLFHREPYPNVIDLTGWFVARVESFPLNLLYSRIFSTRSDRFHGLYEYFMELCDQAYYGLCGSYEQKTDNVFHF